LKIGKIYSHTLVEIVIDWCCLKIKNIRKISTMQSAKSNEQAGKFREVGSELLTQGKFFDALVAFNQSLCLAEAGSREISLAFEGRSEVFFKLEEFEKCLRNIEAAREHDYPVDKLETLRECEEKCKILITKSSPKCELRNFVEMKLPKNEKIPFLADCIELRHCEKFGRFLITTRDLIPGDVIAIEESHYHFIKPTAIFMRCFNCFRSNMLDLIPSSASGEFIKKYFFNLS
jgi:SET and MYND domain-containing protein 4